MKIMTTIQELRIIVSSIKPQTELVRIKSQELHSFVEELDQAINGIAGDCIDVDALISKYASIWIEKLTALETASDALGTDSLH